MPKRRGNYHDPLKPRDKITQKMSHVEAIELNKTKDTVERISKCELDADFKKPAEQTAEESAAQLDPTVNKTPTLPFVQKQDTGLTERIISRPDEERATPELERSIQKSDKAADKLDKASAPPKKRKF